MLKHSVLILKEMCKRVNADYHSIDFEGDAWFWEYSWTQIEEDSFIDWLAEYLYAHKDARTEIMKHPVNTKKLCRQFAENFTWNYGWKVVPV